MKQLTVYNTELRKKEQIVPLKGRLVRMYTCGPTVYDYAHIGNLRTYVFEDILRRTLKCCGFDVVQVMNITDIDDKTIRGAIERGVSLKELTETYTKTFFEDLLTLNIEKVEHYPRATEFIPHMITLIERLIKRHFAYKGRDGSIYFSIKHFPRYGRLSHLHLDELQLGLTVPSDEYGKDQLADFVLWKIHDPSRDGPIYWPSPWGNGRPGWHIECSTMAIALLGGSIDIHAGGVDNIFPHHENEIAQSEACTGTRFATYWVHAEHLLVDHKKMSKSLGNFYTLRDLLAQGYTGPQVRYFLLQAHYRTQLNFTFDGLAAAGHALARITDFIRRMRDVQAEQVVGGSDVDVAEVEEQFFSAIADDLNVPAALGVLFDFIRDVNGRCDAHRLSSDQACEILGLLRKVDTILGVAPVEEAEVPLSPELLKLLELRESARKQRLWAEADKYRDELQALGYRVEDTPGGARLKRRS